MRCGSSASERARAATSGAASVPGANRHCTVVDGQSRNSPGAGSSTGSSPASRKVTALAPQARQALFGLLRVECAEREGQGEKGVRQEASRP